jgi:membrane-associated protease RseP (regulator of RpoE activity)
MNDGDQQDPTGPGEFPPPTSGEDTTAAASTPTEEAAPVASEEIDDTAPVAATPVDDPTVTAPVAATPTEQPPVAAAPVAAAPARRKGVFVPVWALATVGSVLLLLVGGLVGYAIGSDDADTNSRVAIDRPGSGIPDIGNFFGPSDGNGGNGNGGNGNRNGNGNGNNDGGNGNAPSAPSGNGAFLGVAVRDSSSGSGAALVRVVPESPAADAGLRSGDVITAVDGKSIADAAALTERIGALDTGDEITVTYRRDGDSKTVTVTLGDRATTSTQ